MPDNDEENIYHKIGKVAFIIIDLVALFFVWGNDWMTTSILMPVMLIGLPAGVAVLPILFFGKEAKHGLLRLLFSYCGECLNMVFMFDIGSIVGAVGLFLGWLVMVPIGVLWSLHTLIVTTVQIVRYAVTQEWCATTIPSHRSAANESVMKAQSPSSSENQNEGDIGGAIDDGNTIVFD